MKGPLLADVEGEIRSIRMKWQVVGKAFQDSHPACEECSYHKVTPERRPYGIGYATEWLSDCTLGERGSDKPEQCPAFQQLSEQEAEHG